MRRTIRLTESELRDMIEMSINEAMQDEGFGNQLMQGAKSFFGRGDMGKKNYNNRVTRSGNGGFNFGKRWDAAKQNFKSQGTIDNANDFIATLKNYMQKAGLGVSNQIGELWGYLDSQVKGQATRRGSMAQNAIYK
jgi:hypothetical protein